MITPDSLTVLGPRRGRKTRAEAPSRPLGFRFSPAEIERLELAAKLNHQSVSQFTRDVVLTAAEDCLDPNS